MQGVLHFSATNAGLVTTPMMVAMVCGSLIGGQVVSRTGKYKWITVFGMGISATGMYMLSMLTPQSSQARGMMDMAVLGFGLGFTIPTLTLAAQNAVPYSMLGVVSAFSQFARSVGGTIGVAIMGSVMTRQLDSHLAGGLSPEVQQGAPAPLLEALQSPRVLLDSRALNLLHDQGFVPIFGADADRLFNGTVTSMKTALAASITDIFFISTMIMLTAFAVTFLLAELPLRVTNEVPTAFEAPPDAEPEPAPAHAAEAVARGA